MTARRLATLHLSLAALALTVASCSSSGGGGGGGGNDEQDGNQDSQTPADQVTGLGGEELPHFDEIPAALVPDEFRNQERVAGQDLSALMPTPKQQGQLNSCVGFSTAYGLMTYLAASHIEGWGDLDTPERQFSPSFVFNLANSAVMGRPSAAGKTCIEVGAYVPDVEMLLRDRGCATWGDMPYDPDECSAQPTASVLSAAANFRIKQFDKTVYDVESVQSYLDQGSPSIALLKIGEGFFELAEGEVYDEADAATSEMRHAVLVVGYEVEPATIKIMNSWGTDWGDGGYGRISAEIWPDIVSELWIVDPALQTPFLDSASEPTNEKGSVAQQPDDADWCAVSPKLDSDGDGYTDLIERIFGLDPQTPDENPDFIDRPDADGDGYPDTTEAVFGTDPQDVADFPFDCDYQFPAGFFDDVVEDDRDGDESAGRLTAVVNSQTTGGRGAASPGSVVVLDADGDGNLDVAVANQGDSSTGETGTVSLLLGNGDGTLSEPLVIPELTAPEYLTALDLNGDDDADLAVADASGDVVTFLEADGAGGYSFGDSLELENPLRQPMTAIDLDGDGQAELVARNNDGVDIYAAEAGGTYTWRGEVVLEDADSFLAATLCAPLAADLNGDGNADLAHVALTAPTEEDLGAGDWDYNLILAIWLGAGDGLTFTRSDLLEISVPLEEAFQMVYTCPAVGEFNGDGRPDMVGFIGQDQGMFIVAGTDQGVAPTAQRFDAPQGATIAWVTTSADADGDGFDDLVIPQADGGLALLRNDRAGGFEYFESDPELLVEYSSTSVLAQAPLVQAVGDMNGDGLDDVITYGIFVEDVFNPVFEGIVVVHEDLRVVRE